MSLKAIWSEYPTVSKFILAMGIVLLCMGLFLFISVFIAMAVYGLGLVQLQNLLTDVSNPQSIPLMKLIQTCSAIGTFIIPAFIIAYLIDQRPMNYLSLNKRVRLVPVVLVILAVIVSLPLINFLGELNSRMVLPSFLSGLEKWMKDSEDKAAELTKSFLVMNSVSDMLFNVFMIALLPAIGEELLFRGIIQKLFSQWTKNVHAGIWISAILFSAMHVQFYGFVPRMMLGVLLGYLLYWSGSLWLPIFAHFVNNAAAIVFTYLFREQLVNIDTDKIGTENDFAAVLVSSLLFVVLLWLIYKSTWLVRSQQSAVYLDRSNT
jgi:membrane protease YdiL (CAAX protease family)